MGDPHSVVSYHDPYDSPINYDYLNFMSDSNPTLANLSSTNEPTSCYPSANDIADPIQPSDVPMVWNIFYDRSNSATTQSQNAGPSRSCSGREASNAQASILGDNQPISVWPPEPAPFRCTCCQVLREIIHTDGAGNIATKLEIHGRLGMICHAIFENKDHVNAASSESQYYMIDFCKKNIVNVKEYLQQYCNDQKRAGYIMVQDPLSIFYEVLCVGIEWEENRNNYYPSPSGIAGRVDQMEGDNEVERGSKSNLAQQRERTGKLTLKDFEDYFHLPIEEAARRMHLCPTVVKKICRRAGMTRWPYRKVKSIQRQISNLRAISNSNDADERDRAQAEILRLQAQISNVCAGATN